MQMKRKIRKKIKLGIATAAIGASVVTAAAANANYINDALQHTLFAQAAETVPRPSGNVIARGEDGVPWELYENGYLLFKPEPGKDTLKNKGGDSIWKLEHGAKIKHVGFAGNVYAPPYSYQLFSKRGFSKDLEFDPLTFDTTNLDTSKVHSMDNMFSNLSKLTNLDVTHFDTRNVTDMSSMFSNMYELTSLDVTHFDTRKVTNMSFMFYNLHKLTSLDVTHFNTSEVKRMDAMFENLHKLVKLDVTHFDTSKVIDMESMFSGLYKLTDLDVTHFDTSNVKHMSGMFSGMSNVTTLNVSSFDTHNVTDMNAMFSGMSKLNNLDVTHFNTSNVTGMSGMFSDTSNLTNLDVTHFNTSNVTDMSGMFRGMSNLTSLDVTNFDTSNVTDMEGMFRETSSLTKLDVSRFDTRNVTSASWMFGGMSSITSLDVTNFDMNKVTDISSILRDMPKLKELKLGDKFKANGLRTTLSIHDYGKQYTHRWHKVNDEEHVYEVNDWANLYAANPTASAGAWVRERRKDTTITFHGQGTPPTVIKHGSPMLTRFPDPTNIKPGQRFKGWSRTTDGDVITPDSIQPGENITLYPRWEPVDNTSTTTEKIAITTEYRSDNSLDYGTRNETPGREGEKQVTTTYTVTPITGKLTNPIKTEVITTPMQPKIVTIGTKPTDRVTEIPSPKKYVKDPDRRKGEPDIIEKGTPGSITTTTTYTVNPKNGDITSNVGTPVRKDPTPTIIKVAAKDDIEVIKKPSPIIYEKDPNRARNTPDEKTEGTPGSVTTVTSYDIDESNGHPTARRGNPVTKEPTPTIIRIGAKDHTVNTPIPPKVRYEKDPNRERNTPDEKIVGNPGNSAVTTVYNVNPKDGTVTETQQPPVITPPGTTIIRIGAKDHTDVKVIPSKVIYEKDPTRDRGEPDIKKEGTPGKETTVTTYDVDPNDGTVTSHVGTPTKVDSTPTIIKIAARDKVEMIHKNGSDPIRRTTRYDVDPDTGNVTESHKDELPATGTFGTLISVVSAATLIALSVSLKRLKKTS